MKIDYVKLQKSVASKLADVQKKPMFSSILKTGKN